VDETNQPIGHISAVKQHREAADTKVGYRLRRVVGLLLPVMRLSNRKTMRVRKVLKTI
jgi:hypothetical protein